MSTYINQVMRWLNPKNQDRNLISAGIQMLVITLVSMSMADLNWFSITGSSCTPSLTLGMFFWFGYTAIESDEDFKCINSSIVNMMRIILLLSFMAIIFSLIGFFLDLLAPKASIYKILRRYAIPSICAVLWLTVTISISYYVVLLLEDSLGRLYPEVETYVSCGIGFYLLAAADGLTLFGIFYILIVMQHPMENMRNNNCLIEPYEDSLDSFNSPTPPPPYNVPPPPYEP